jgi:hypothetical protein
MLAKLSRLLGKAVGWVYNRPRCYSLILCQEAVMKTQLIIAAALCAAPFVSQAAPSCWYSKTDPCIHQMNITTPASVEDVDGQIVGFFKGPLRYDYHRDFKVTGPHSLQMLTPGGPYTVDDMVGPDVVKFETSVNGGPDIAATPDGSCQGSNYKPGQPYNISIHLTGTRSPYGYSCLVTPAS